jgi:hypothetical protein
MKEHLFLSVSCQSQTEEEETLGLLEFDDFSGADAYLRDWLTRVCGMDCFTGAAEEAALRAQNGGELPEYSFACPAVDSPADLEGYNGFYFRESAGAFSLFVIAIYDTDSARRFRGQCVREFRLDQTPDEEGDERIADLRTLERSFTEEVDYAEAAQRVDTLLRCQGLLYN